MKSTLSHLFTPIVPTQQSALSPKTWPFDLTLLPQAAYLVGGSVRDALLERRADYLDLDFVLPQGAIQTARSVATHYKAGFVVLDAEHQIARVVFDQATVDFAQQVGPDLESDLHRRDFTINAIAYHPHTQALLDPLNGYSDLQLKTLRMIAPDNLAEDPLRLLRAYRQAAQLGFQVDPQTQNTIRELSSLISRVAAERVRGELDCLLSLPEGTSLLRQAWRDGVLRSWLPALTANQIDQLQHIDRVMATVGQQMPAYRDLLLSWIREQTAPGLHRSWLKATKLSQLLGRNMETAEVTLSTLKYSRAEQQATLAILKGEHYLREVLPDGLSRRQQYTLFKMTGPSFVGVALLALTWPGNEAQILALIQRYLDPQDPIAHPRSLVSGRDLIKELGLKPGPRIGELLTAIQVAQAEGLITTREEALAWAEQQHSSTAT